MGLEMSTMDRDIERTRKRHEKARAKLIDRLKRARAALGMLVIDAGDLSRMTFAGTDDANRIGATLAEVCVMLDHVLKPAAADEAAELGKCECCGDEMTGQRRGVCRLCSAAGCGPRHDYATSGAWLRGERCPIHKEKTP